MRTWLLVCAAVAIAAPVRAQAPQEGTIEQLVAMALERSPEIRAARAATAVAAGEVTQASLRPNPTLSATQMQMSGAQHQFLAQIDWPLDLFRRTARVDAAQKTADATGFSVQDRERMLAFTVRQQGGRLLAARRTLEITKEALDAAQRTRQLLDSQVTEGGIPKIDANLAAVEAGRIESDVILAQADVDSATIELRALVGMEANAPLALRDTLESLVRPAVGSGQPAGGSEAAMPNMPTMPDMDMSKMAVAMRPDVKESMARLAAATARVDSARQQGRLDMSLVGNYGQEHYGFAQRGFTSSGAMAPVEGTFQSVTFGATLMLPVRNKNQGALASAEAERGSEEQALAARQLVAQGEIDAAMLRDREAKRAVEMYTTSVRELARQNVEVELEAYDLGRTPLTDLLAEQRRYLDVEKGYTTLLGRAYDAQVALRAARGETK
jgi:cobalt-zinc-cadmium efflux system outer membrane protein